MPEVSGFVQIAKVPVGGPPEAVTWNVYPLFVPPASRLSIRQAFAELGLLQTVALPPMLDNAVAKPALG